MTSLVLAYTAHDFDVRQNAAPTHRTIRRAMALSRKVGDVALISNGVDGVVFRDGQPCPEASNQLRLTLSPPASVVVSAGESGGVL